MDEKLQKGFSFVLLFGLLFFAALGGGAEIELFCDWEGNAKGQSFFPLMEEVPLKDLPLPSFLRRKLRAQGDEIRSWEAESYRPWLLNWKGVKTFADFKHWLGIGLPRKEAILPNTKYWLFWNLGPKLKDCDLSKIPKEKLILVMWEPPIVQPMLYTPKIQDCFGKIFTWNDDLVDNQKFFKIHYPALTPRIENIPSFEEKKFCVIVCRRFKSSHPNELYSKRVKTIEFFEEKPIGELDLYGFYWEKKKYKNWKGPLHSSKLEKIKEYKFSICYENMCNVKGYITEKIFDCFAAASVPVYWGASNVTDFIPPECFIDRRRFAGEEEMYQFLKAMTKEDYQQYLDKAAEFLLSDKAKVFTVAHFAEQLLSRL